VTTTDASKLSRAWTCTETFALVKGFGAGIPAHPLPAISNHAAGVLRSAKAKPTNLWVWTASARLCYAMLCYAMLCRAMLSNPHSFFFVMHLFNWPRPFRGPEVQPAVRRARRPGPRCAYAEGRGYRRRPLRVYSSWPWMLCGAESREKRSV
jgi:hypothetical protein